MPFMTCCQKAFSRMKRKLGRKWSLKAGAECACPCGLSAPEDGPENGRTPGKSYFPGAAKSLSSFIRCNKLANETFMNLKKSFPIIHLSSLLWLCLLPLCWPELGLSQPDPNWLDHDRARPLPAVVGPATSSTQEKPGKPPSDATVLFDGKDLSQWAGMDGSPTKWISRDGYMECVKGSGYVRTLQNFGDCQLHIEWAAPVPGEGEGQGRGNSGVFFGLDRYEVQVLDSYGNKTYADGSAGAIYGQYPRLANACLPPGRWQTYDIIY